MLTLDEQLQDLTLLKLFDWYPGRVINVRDLRRDTLVDDDNIHTLLQHTKQPTFVTINWQDFWRRIPPHKNYCVICVKIDATKYLTVPQIVRWTLNQTAFKTKAARMGKVLLVQPKKIKFYEVGQPQILELSLNTPLWK